VSATPQAKTVANIPSADTPTQTAPGKSTAKGRKARAARSAPSARSATATATTPLQPTSTVTVDAATPPPSPIRSSHT